MFRAQNNPYDEAVVKATDENLTSENWEYIMNVVDKVGAQDDGAKDVVAALIKRLAHRNANVQLYTLELANALSQNCGRKLHQELASRSFTDALLRLAADRNTHREVKAKILERMGEWVEMFSRDPDLGIMEQAYMKLKTQNPNLHPPSKPQKQQITDSDRQREEEELQMALRLSIQDKPQPSAAKSNQPQATAAAPVEATPSQPAPQGTTAATVSRVRALFDFQPSEPGELAFKKGDIIAVLESVYKDWWRGSLRGQTGIFPLNYVEKLQDPTKEEMEREAQMEAEVFAEIRNVEKLLALLSTSSRTGDGDVRDNEEITELYHSTLAIRPKLIELIGKYSQKKDDFTQLNEKFIKARKDYETLLEASMSQPIGYGRQPYSYGPGSGGPPPSNTYSGPPPQVGGYPPQGPPHDPQRFYSPAPQEPQYPPQNNAAPFYMIPPSQQPNLSQQAVSPMPSRVPVGAAGRPQSIAFGGPNAAAGGIPQELATSTFDSPVDNRQSFIQPSQPPTQRNDTPYQPYHAPHSPSFQPPGQAPAPYQPLQQQQHFPQRQDSYDSQPPIFSPPQQQSTPHGYPPQNQHIPQQPSQPPMDGPSAPTPQAPGGYPALSPGPGAAPGGYQAYQPGQRWPSGGSAPGVRAAGASDGGEDFYR